jgi:aubergine-like protein
LDDNLVVGLPPRPESQAPSRVVQLFANYFPIAVNVQNVIYQYAVFFEPAMEASNVRQKLVYAKKDLGVAMACDGQLLFTPKKVPDQSWTASTAGGDVKIDIRLVKEIKAADGVPYQLCNILLKRLFRDMKMVMISRNYYSPDRRVPFPQYNLELWPGCVTSVNPVQSGISLICDISHKTIRLDSVLQTINMIRNNMRGGNWQAAVDAELAGAIVLTRYNNCTYRIDKVEWTMSPRSTFDWDGHGKTSFSEYLLRVYDKKVTDDKQPLLVSTRRQRQLHLVPEFCFRTGLSEDMRKDYRLMSDLARHTRPDPTARAREVSEIVKKLATFPDSKKQLDLWGIQITPSITQCTGFVVEPPRIQLGAGMVIPSESRGKADWTFGMQRAKVASAVPISSWAILFPGDVSGEIQDFAMMVVRMANGMGFQLSQPQPLAVNSP